MFWGVINVAIIFSDLKALFYSLVFYLIITECFKLSIVINSICCSFKRIVVS